MARYFALILLMLVSACASRQPVPPAPVAAAPAQAEPTEPLDPRIHPLSREEEELAR
jgi:hypothetical protein